MDTIIMSESISYNTIIQQTNQISFKV